MKTSTAWGSPQTIPVISVALPKAPAVTTSKANSVVLPEAIVGVGPTPITVASPFNNSYQINSGEMAWGEVAVSFQAS